MADFYISDDEDQQGVQQDVTPQAEPKTDLDNLYKQIIQKDEISPEEAAFIEAKKFPDGRPREAILTAAPEKPLYKKILEFPQRVAPGLFGRPEGEWIGDPDDEENYRKLNEGAIAALSHGLINRLVPDVKAEQVQKFADRLANAVQGKFGEPQPRKKPSDAAGYTAGAINLIKNLLDIFTSPAGFVGGLGGITRQAPRVIAGLFAHSLLKDLPESAQAAGYASVSGTPQEKVERLGGLAANLLFAGTSAFHTAAPKKPGQAGGAKSWMEQILPGMTDEEFKAYDVMRDRAREYALAKWRLENGKAEPGDFGIVSDFENAAEFKDFEKPLNKAFFTFSNLPPKVVGAMPPEMFRLWRWVTYKAFSNAGSPGFKKIYASRLHAGLLEQGDTKTAGLLENELRQSESPELREHAKQLTKARYDYYEKQKQARQDIEASLRERGVTSPGMPQPERPRIRIVAEGAGEPKTEPSQGPIDTSLKAGEQKPTEPAQKPAIPPEEQPPPPPAQTVFGKMGALELFDEYKKVLSQNDFALAEEAEARMREIAEQSPDAEERQLAQKMLEPMRQMREAQETLYRVQKQQAATRPAQENRPAEQAQPVEQAPAVEQRPQAPPPPDYNNMGVLELFDEHRKATNAGNFQLANELEERMRRRVEEAPDETARENAQRLLNHMIQLRQGHEELAKLKGNLAQQRQPATEAQKPAPEAQPAGQQQQEQRPSHDLWSFLPEEPEIVDAAYVASLEYLYDRAIEQGDHLLADEIERRLDDSLIRIRDKEVMGVAVDQLRRMRKARAARQQEAEKGLQEKQQEAEKNKKRETLRNLLNNETKVDESFILTLSILHDEALKDGLFDVAKEIEERMAQARGQVEGNDNLQSLIDAHLQELIKKRESKQNQAQQPLTTNIQTGAEPAANAPATPEKPLPTNLATGAKPEEQKSPPASVMAPETPATKPPEQTAAPKAGPPKPPEPLAPAAEKPVKPRPPAPTTGVTPLPTPITTSEQKKEKPESEKPAPVLPTNLGAGQKSEEKKVAPEKQAPTAVSAPKPVKIRATLWADGSVETQDEEVTGFKFARDENNRIFVNKYGIAEITNGEDSYRIFIKKLSPEAKRELGWDEASVVYEPPISPEVEKLLDELRDIHASKEYEQASQKILAQKRSHLTKDEERAFNRSREIWNEISKLPPELAAELPDDAFREWQDSRLDNFSIQSAKELHRAFLLRGEPIAAENIENKLAETLVNVHSKHPDDRAEAKRHNKETKAVIDELWRAREEYKKNKKATPPAPAPAEPAKPIELKPTPPIPTGAKVEVVGKGDDKYPGVYSILPLSELQASHTETFSPNEKYPLSNTRQYHLESQKAERDKVNKGAYEPIPDLLVEPSVSASVGPPVVAWDRGTGQWVVLGGNGRTLMYKIMPEEKRAQVHEYAKQSAKKLGLPEPKTPDDVIVRVIDPIDTSTREGREAANRIVDSLNRSDMLSRSPFNMGKDDARNIPDDDALQLLDELTEAAPNQTINIYRRFVERMIGSGKIEQASRASILDNDVDVRTYVESFLAEKAFPNSTIPRLMADSNTPATIRGLMKVAMPTVLRLRSQKTAFGEKLANVITGALDKVSLASDDISKISSALEMASGQSELGESEASKAGRALIYLLQKYANVKTDKKTKSQAALSVWGKIFNYLDQALANQKKQGGGENLFGTVEDDALVFRRTLQGIMTEKEYKSFGLKPVSEDSQTPPRFGYNIPALERAISETTGKLPTSITMGATKVEKPTKPAVKPKGKAKVAPVEEKPPTTIRAGEEEVKPTEPPAKPRITSGQEAKKKETVPIKPEEEKPAPEPTLDELKAERDALERRLKKYGELPPRDQARLEEVKMAIEKAELGQEYLPQTKQAIIPDEETLKKQQRSFVEKKAKEGTLKPQGEQENLEEGRKQPELLPTGQGDIFSGQPYRPTPKPAESRPAAEMPKPQVAQPQPAVAKPAEQPKPAITQAPVETKGRSYQQVITPDFGKNNKTFRRSAFDGARRAMPKPPSAQQDPNGLKLYTNASTVGGFLYEAGVRDFKEWERLMREMYETPDNPRTKDTNYWQKIYKNARMMLDEEGGESLAAIPAKGPGDLIIGPEGEQRGGAEGEKKTVEVQFVPHPSNPKLLIARPEYTKPAPDHLERLAREHPELANLRNSLAPHQVEAFNTMYSAITRPHPNKAGLLADGTGAGKTRVMLALAHAIAVSEKRPVIMVVPQAVLKANWAKGTSKGGSYFKDAKQMGIPLVLAREGAIRPGEIIITTYENVGKWADAMSWFPARSENAAFVIFDESHYLKTPDSRRTIEAKAMIRRANKVLFSSATPADKPVHIHYLETLGIGRFDDVMKKLGYEKVQRQGRRQDGTPYDYYTWEIAPHVTAQEIAKRYSELFDKLTADGVMIKREISMAPLNIRVLEFETPDEARMIIDDFEFFYWEHKTSNTALDRANLMMICRRYLEPFKIPFATNIALKELNNGRKVVIYLSRVNQAKAGAWSGKGLEKTYHKHSDIASTLDELRNALIESGVEEDKIGELSGRMTEEEIHDAVKNFNEGDVQVLISTVETGGAGINLDDATGNHPRSVIFMTAPFSGIENVQALGRVNRLTTKSNSNIYYLFTKHPIDEWNSDIVMHKLRLMGATVKGQLAGLDEILRDRERAKMFDDLTEENLEADINTAKSPEELLKEYLQRGRKKRGAIQGGAAKGEGEAAKGEGQPVKTAPFPSVPWREVRTKDGGKFYVYPLKPDAPETKAFWDWWHEQGGKENKLDIRVRKIPEKYRKTQGADWEVVANAPYEKGAAAKEPSTNVETGTTESPPNPDENLINPIKNGVDDVSDKLGTRPDIEIDNEEKPKKPGEEEGEEGLKGAPRLSIYYDTGTGRIVLRPRELAKELELFGSDEKAKQNYMEALGRHEAIHHAALELLDPIEAASIAVWLRERHPKKYKKFVESYTGGRDVELSDFQIGHEIYRAELERILYGRTTESYRPENLSLFKVAREYVHSIIARVLRYIRSKLGMENELDTLLARALERINAEKIEANKQRLDAQIRGEPIEELSDSEVQNQPGKNLAAMPAAPEASPAEQKKVFEKIKNTYDNVAKARIDLYKNAEGVIRTKALNDYQAHRAFSLLHDVTKALKIEVAALPETQIDPITGEPYKKSYLSDDFIHHYQDMLNREVEKGVLKPDEAQPKLRALRRAQILADKVIRAKACTKLLNEYEARQATLNKLVELGVWKQSDMAYQMELKRLEDIHNEFEKIRDGSKFGENSPEAIMQDVMRLRDFQKNEIDYRARQKALQLSTVRNAFGLENVEGGTFQEVLDAVKKLTGIHAQKAHSELLDKLMEFEALAQRVDADYEAARKELGAEIERLSKELNEAELNRAWAVVHLTDYLNAMKGKMTLDGTFFTNDELEDAASRLTGIGMFVLDLAKRKPDLTANELMTWLLNSNANLPEIPRQIANLLGIRFTNNEEGQRALVNLPQMPISDEAVAAMLRYAQRLPGFASALARVFEKAKAEWDNNPGVRLAQIIALNRQIENLEGKAKLKAEKALQEMLNRFVQDETAVMSRSELAAKGLLEALKQKQIRLKTYEYAKALFDEVRGAEGYADFQFQVMSGPAGGAKVMLHKSDRAIVLSGFSIPRPDGKLESVAPVLLSTDFNSPFYLPNKIGAIMDWRNKAEEYVNGYYRAMNDYNSGATDKTPIQAGYNPMIVAGLEEELKPTSNLASLYSATWAIPEQTLRSNKFLANLTRLGLFRQLNEGALQLQGPFGAQVASDVADLTAVEMKLRTLFDQKLHPEFAEIPKLRKAALDSHRDDPMIRTQDDYRRFIFNPMGEHLRQFGVSLAAGDRIGPGNLRVTAADLELFKRLYDLDVQIREVLAGHSIRGLVRREAQIITPTGEKATIEYRSRAIPVGEMGTSRIINRSGEDFVRQLSEVLRLVDEMEKKNPGSTAITYGDLSKSNHHPLIDFYNSEEAQNKMLYSHISAAGRTDLANKRSPLMTKLEMRLAEKIRSGKLTRPLFTVDDYVRGLLDAAQELEIKGLSYEQVAREFLGELAKYNKYALDLAADMPKEKTSEAWIAAASKLTEFTTEANLLKLPGCYYDYSVLTDADIASKVVRGLAEWNVKLVTSLRHAADDLSNRIRLVEEGVKKPEEILSDYNGDVFLARVIRDTTRQLADDVLAKQVHQSDLAQKAYDIHSLLVGNWLTSPAAAGNNVLFSTVAAFDLMAKIGNYNRVVGGLMTAINILKTLPKAVIQLAGGLASYVPGSKAAVDWLIKNHPEIYQSIIKWAHTLRLDSIYDELQGLHETGLATDEKSLRQQWQKIISEVQYPATKAELYQKESGPLGKAATYAGAGLRLTAAGVNRISAVRFTDALINANSLFFVDKIRRQLEYTARQYLKRIEQMQAEGKLGDKFDPTNKEWAVKPEEFSHRLLKGDQLANIAYMRSWLRLNTGAELEQLFLDYGKRLKADPDAQLWDNEMQQRLVRGIVAHINKPIPGRNRAILIGKDRFLTWFAMLQGYTGDLLLKLTDGFRSAHGAASYQRILTPTLYLMGLAAMAAYAGGTALTYRDWWAYLFEGRLQRAVTPLDKEFWANPVTNTSLAAFSAIPYIGTAMLQILGEIRGRRGFDPADSIVAISQLHDLQMLFGSLWALRDNPASWPIPLRRWAERNFPYFRSIEYITGTGRADYTSGVNSFYAVAKNKGLIKERAQRQMGFFIPGVPSALSDRLRRAIMDGDTTEIKEIKGELYDYHYKTAIENGKTPDEAKRLAEVQTKRDYISLSPVLQATNRRKFAQSEYEDVVNSMNDRQRFAFERVQKAWKAAAPLFNVSEGSAALIPWKTEAEEQAPGVTGAQVRLQPVAGSASGTTGRGRSVTPGGLPTSLMWGMGGMGGQRVSTSPINLRAPAPLRMPAIRPSITAGTVRLPTGLGSMGGRMNRSGGRRSMPRISGRIKSGIKPRATLTSKPLRTKLPTRIRL